MGQHKSELIAREWFSEDPVSDELKRPGGFFVRDS
jgi:hypothetical protein